MKTWANQKPGGEKNEEVEDKHKKNTYLQQVIQEAVVGSWEASSSKFEWMLDKLKSTTGTKILVFSSW